MKKLFFIFSFVLACVVANAANVADTIQVNINSIERFVTDSTLTKDNTYKYQTYAIIKVNGKKVLAAISDSNYKKYWMMKKFDLDNDVYFIKSKSSNKIIIE